MDWLSFLVGVLAAIAGYGLRAFLAWISSPLEDAQAVIVALNTIDRVHAANATGDPDLLDQVYDQYPDSGAQLARAIVLAAEARGMSRSRLLGFIASLEERKLKPEGVGSAT